MFSSSGSETEAAGSCPKMLRPTEGTVLENSGASEPTQREAGMALKAVVVLEGRLPLKVVVDSL